MRSVLQYRRKFLAVANARKDLDIEVVMCVFLHGLKIEIQAELKVSQFQSLIALMDKVLELEDRNLAWKERDMGHFPRGYFQRSNITLGP